MYFVTLFLGFNILAFVVIFMIGENDGIKR